MWLNRSAESLSFVVKTSDQHLEKEQLYVGTYTKKELHVHGKAEGIYVLQCDNQDGTLDGVSLVAEVTNPSYIIFSPDRDSIVVFAIDERSGKLSPTGHCLNVKTPVCLKFKPVVN